MTRFVCPSCGLWEELIDPDAQVGHDCKVARRFIRFVKKEKP